MRDLLYVLIAQEKFNNFEYTTVIDALRSHQLDYQIASCSTSPALGYLYKTAQGYQPLTVKPDLSIAEMDLRSCRGLILIGGSGVKVSFWKNAILHQQLQRVDRQNCLIGAICLAPITLIYAKILTEGDITVYKTQETLSILQRHGLRYVDQKVLIRGKVITANGPKASHEFAQAITREILA